MSFARRPPHGRTWLRTLVLLLALLVPTAPVQLLQPREAPVAAAGEIVEYDVLDTALRPPARTAHRPAAPLRPASRHETCPGPPRPPVGASPRLPCTPPAPRSVVLRC
ncbi:hypothetical protein [Streptomyces sp. NPDC005374]|uniref:hypothetical protein n=1 Tax=Streptomyces sp. NPDC005374 TaxID=3364713 RepID=UPI0036B21C86